MLKMIKYKWNQLFCLHIFKYLHSSVRKLYAYIEVDYMH